MIEVDSYLVGADGRFVLIGEAVGPPPDPHYIEGAIELTVNGVPILDLDTFDYVDQLWAYIADMVRSLQIEGAAGTYLPDQPVELLFQQQGFGRVLVTRRLGSISLTALAQEDELVSALRVGGTAFFKKMIELVPQNANGYIGALERLNKG
ncbi:hypothetical protein GBF35_11170 [Nonomuraea phyllanthi]|uniref:hypothetical protein n=1 Tax=Nonomuraea phyllanthi TaxID=2219224 RepID=UPI00129402D2|nr:hypothetical protein [Nonomuraea phyllanthi]QFY07174.1 hypothetical protein GBF35_11170 [Nonomuraea phyllanthi]